ncbi:MULTISPECIES: hypothetical protein [unclassified Streptomyces]|uniref:hypothetical protein n=1 Tax=unclassified Streptomyces TaxID=2593676 RepID=UPI00070E9DBB|nr:hypothetical protein [Streptomyces sp. Root1310]KQX65006.1 hypothetical protein ASD48_18045 [Streptomyces sp. Root1310]
MGSALLAVVGGLLLPVAVLMLIVGRRWLWGPEALEWPWRLLYLSVLAVLFLVIGLALWTDSGCGADCEPVVTPVFP